MNGALTPGPSPGGGLGGRWERGRGEGAFRGPRLVRRETS